MFIEDQMMQMNSVFLVMAILTGVILLLAGILISHRIAEAMYRLNQDLRMMADKKELRSLEFRKKDFFQEIPEAFNMVVDSFNKENKK